MSNSRKANQNFLVITGYVFAISGSVIGMIIGYKLMSKVKSTEISENAFRYNDRDRKHGKIMDKIAGTMFFIGLFLKLVS